MQNSFIIYFFIMTIKQHVLYDRINAALDSIRPHLQADGGDVEIVEITDKNVLRIRWIGACESCNMSIMTMRAGIEQSVQSHVPEIIKVEAINGIDNSALDTLMSFAE